MMVLRDVLYKPGKVVKAEAIASASACVMELAQAFLLYRLIFRRNPRFLMCFGIAWTITNGWSYILLAVGTVLDIGWMIAVASGYLAFLWLPVSPEKLVTIATAIVLLRVFFPNDQKTLGMLRALQLKLKIKKARYRHIFYATHRHQTGLTFLKHFSNNSQTSSVYNC